VPYFTQMVSEDDPGRKDMLFDIATEEPSHLEIIGSIVAMRTKAPRVSLRKPLSLMPSCIGRSLEEAMIRIRRPFFMEADLR
jgi:Mn-containing catalase